VSHHRIDDVLELVASGLGDKEIAVALCITRKTVRCYLERHQHATGLRGRTALAVAWLLDPTCCPLATARVRARLRRLDAARLGVVA